MLCAVPQTKLKQPVIKDIVLEKLTYSNVSIPKHLDWRQEVTELVSGVETGFRLVKKTLSGNFIVQISSPKKSNLITVLDRAIEKY
jgi:hypothetical protein